MEEIQDLDPDGMTDPYSIIQFDPPNEKMEMDASQQVFIRIAPGYTFVHPIREDHSLLL